LGAVIHRERTGNGISRIGELSAEEFARLAACAPAELEQLERGEHPAERWFPVLCGAAVTLEVPVGLLVSPDGRSDSSDDAIGSRLLAARSRLGLSVEAMAQSLRLSAVEYASVERGHAPFESCGKLMLRVAEVLDQPLFNLYMPCGVSYRDLDNYP
jgi:transcriptional regulator with XRE-family HTH domain